MIKRIKIVLVSFLVAITGILFASTNTQAHTGSETNDIRINAGGPAYVDFEGNSWEADTLYNTGNVYSTSNPIGVTSNDVIYQSERWDSAPAPELIYSIPVENGTHKLVLHFAEIYFTSIGKRVFDIKAEGLTIQSNLDIVSEVGANTALVKEYEIEVADGELTIEFIHDIENPKISAIEIHPITTEPSPEPEPEAFEYRINAGGAIYTDANGKIWAEDQKYNTGNAYTSSIQDIVGTSNDQIYKSERWDPGAEPELEYAIAVKNGTFDVKLHFAEIYFNNSGQRVFNVFIEDKVVLENFDILYDTTPNTALIKTFQTEVADGELNIRFAHVVENPKISAIEISEVIQDDTPSHYAHAVAGADQNLVDVDENGVETVSLDASFSHTHAFGADLISWNWYEGENLITTGEQVSFDLPQGLHTIRLIVEDNLGNRAHDDVVVEVSAPSAIPGLVNYYYDFGNNQISALPDFSTLIPAFGQTIQNVNIESTSGKFAGTPFSDHFASVFEGFIYISEDGFYNFAIESDDGSRLFVDDILVADNDGLHGMVKVNGEINLTAGYHPIRLEFFENEEGAGMKLYWTIPGGIEEIIPAGFLSHNYNQQKPVIHKLNPIAGPIAGGNTVTINGYGFTSLPIDTFVYFGSQTFTGSELNIVNSNTIEFIAPSGLEGEEIDVVVQTFNGISNSNVYTFSSLPPVAFTQGTLLEGIVGPTSLAMGPDGKLYVGTQYGDIYRIGFDENYIVTDTFISSIVQSNEPSFRSILGIAFNPLEDPSNPKVYVSHSQLFHGQEINFYNGKVSAVSGPSLDVIEDIVTGLPVSDHDHGINGLEFGLNGEMYIQVGGNTNAGVPGAISSSGQQKEGALSAATLVAHIQRENFDGAITYDANANQITGLDVEVFASGERNPYDLVLHTNGNLYATDNGANFGFGPKSVDCTTAGNDVEEPDELNLLVEGGYYGHANRKRGETDPRQCNWRSKSEASDSEYTAPLTTFPASTNGLTEYWTNNFAGQLKGQLLASRWQGELFNVELNANGAAVVDVNTLTPNGGLDATVNWDGTIIIAQNNSDKIIFHKPSENLETNLNVTSVFPFRGPTAGGREVTLYGQNFGDINDTTVSINGQECVISAVSTNKITCTTPASSVTGAVDVLINTNAQNYVLNSGYVYMQSVFTIPDPDPTPEPGWSTKQSLPVDLGELASASLDGYIYIIGGHDGSGNKNNKVYKYDPTSDTWSQVADQTAIPATDHASAEVINGKIYLFGGISSVGESNSLAVYDPSSDSWSALAPLTKDGNPYGIGSAASGVIDGKLYIAGGLHSNATIAHAFVYDPAIDSWTEIASMPEGGRNHAAGVGYNGKFYIFGGRCCGGNWPGSGYSNSFVYDPVTDVWSQVAAMPTARGGNGTAVDVDGELFVIGGEGGGPFNGTFKVVESYNPVNNAWTTHADMPTARHGMYPVNVNGNIHVVAGGVTEGFSVSAVHEVLTFDTSTGPEPTPEPTPVPTPEPTPTPTPNPDTGIRINAGGTSFTDLNGFLWLEDQYYNTGNTYQTSTFINGTVEQLLYNSERWDSADAIELKYEIPIDNGDYTIKLHFADIYNGTHYVGARVFDVKIEDVTVENSLDIYSEVGGFYAIVKEYQVSILDGGASIEFMHGVENPKISGIEIINN